MTSDNCRNGKEVTDEVTNWLRIYADGSIDRTWTGPPEPLVLMKPVPAHHAPVNNVSVHDIPSHDPSLRVYFPESPDQEARSPLPVLLHFHGGGFCISHATWFMYHQFYSRLAASIPAVVVSPFLPLAPEHPLPATVDACYDSLLFLRAVVARAERFDDPSVEKLKSAADASRVFLIGDSSGGNLVHQVAARATREDATTRSPLVLAGGILLHPGFVRSARSGSEMDGTREGAMLTLEMVDKFLGYALPAGATKDHPITCPMAAGGLEEVAFPPFLVAVADGDLIRDTNLEYCEAMRRAGKDVEVVVSEGVGHSFYLNKLQVDADPVAAKMTEELVLAIKDFVLRH